MRLPGTRYQEPGWEQVRKLLGQCSLEAFVHLPLAALRDDPSAALSEYVDRTAACLHRLARGARCQADGNSYGESVGELALSLLYELQARPADWGALCQALLAEGGRLGLTDGRAGNEALLRKKLNDMYAVLRDRVDADNYQVACGRPCSPNRLYAYRMLDMAYGAIARLFDNWDAHREQVGAILGRVVDAMPIEARRMKSIADCQPEWIERWSTVHEHFHGTPGPLHTRSKRFESLKQNPGAVAAMLHEIGEYQALSAHQGFDGLERLADADAWLDDLERVLDGAGGQHEDRLLAARADMLDLPYTLPVDGDEACWVGAGTDEAAHEVSAEDMSKGADQGADHARARQAGQSMAADRSGAGSFWPACNDAAPALARAPRAAPCAPACLSSTPGYAGVAPPARAPESWLGRVLAPASPGVQLAVYAKVLGPFDDAYPLDWLDPATGQLPTLQELAARDGISVPTLRKRRDAAIAALNQAAAQPAAPRQMAGRLR
jgi:hypothetical protein